MVCAARAARDAHWVRMCVWCVELAARILTVTLLGLYSAGKARWTCVQGCCPGWCHATYLVGCFCDGVRGGVSECCRLMVVWAACSVADLCFVVVLPSLAVPGLCSFLRVTPSFYTRVTRMGQEVIYQADSGWTRHLQQAVRSSRYQTRHHHDTATQKKQQPYHTAKRQPSQACQQKYQTCVQGCARMHPVIRNLATRH